MGRIQFEKDKVEALEFASPGDGSGTLGMEGHSVTPLVVLPAPLHPSSLDWVEKE